MPMDCPNENVLGLGARVILTKSINVTGDLVNSVETGFLPPPNFISAENYCPKFIL